MTKPEERQLKAVNLVVVGSCNGNPWFLENLGTLILIEKDDLYTPYLVHGVRTRRNPHDIVFSRRERGEYIFEVPDWCGVEGLRISLSTPEGRFWFTTGLHPYDSGSSGPLAFGGVEMTEIFGRIYHP